MFTVSSAVTGILNLYEPGLRDMNGVFMFHLYSKRQYTPIKAASAYRTLPANETCCDVDGGLADLVTSSRKNYQGMNSASFTLVQG